MTRTNRLLLAGAIIAAGVGLIWQPWNATADPLASGPTRFGDNGDSPPSGKEPPAPREQFAQDRTGGTPAAPMAKLPAVSGEQAMKYLKEICDIGPRVSATPGMVKQQKMLVDHFEKCGAKVVRQEFPATQRSQGKPVPMTNLIASWNQDRTRRVILCAHYDTRPAAHEERNQQNWSKPFLSANDGTSGVALLMEMANHLKDFPTGVGIDIVVFDGEEYIFDRGVPGVREGDTYFLGSRHFADEYTKNKAKLPYRYEAAVLLDLFAHDGARLAVEGYSLQGAPGLVDQIWKTAATIGAKSFKYERGFRRGDDVLDDHVPLLQAGIPAIDILDFDYAHWHLLSDTPDKCSPKQMAEVGTVLFTWLAGLK